VKRRHLILALTVLAAGSGLSHTMRSAYASPQGSAWPPQGFRLAGQGVMRWFGLKIYEARLWVTGSGLDAARFEEARFALEITYARTLAGRDIARSSHDEMLRMSLADPSSRERWLAAMTRLFPDVRDTDTLVGINTPGAGVGFLHNGKPIGAIAEPGFARAFFAIWLDPRTAKPDLREQLIGAAGPQKKAGASAYEAAAASRLD
jgi:hypothetical protein